MMNTTARGGNLAIGAVAAAALGVGTTVLWYRIQRTKEKENCASLRSIQSEGRLMVSQDEAEEGHQMALHPAVSMHSLAGSSLQHVAVLVVDCQPVYWDNQSTIRKTNPKLPQNISKLLTKARQLLSPPQIIHIRANYTFKFAQNFKLLNPDKPMPSDIEACSWAASQVGEQIVVKPCFDSFHHTNLERYLNDLQVTDLIICGLLTSCCVLFTAQSAFASGFRVKLLDNACSDRTLECHKQTLNHYGSYCFEVVNDLNSCFCTVPLSIQSNLLVNKVSSSSSEDECAELYK
uniref:Isochorismatase-like domain-containing protein n=1 Tax=Aureoumbra lagunensis TaxID=44058 RepID=A0A7S3JU85_9STRA|mmetsp:Transcript_20918/g.32067  ORF Transcript_20918/g.32067 Transcript_20918/m.32067 type:complete len:291 (-) Transcript_20918:165-1037(-)